ncbi:MAG: response regulator transcription factor [Thaumarchaeota archaeon]|nr:response regulator transcription factor [Nitrososphaerota archaeon]
MKILHIEDNAEIVEPAKLVFESAGHHYDYALDAKMGLQAIRDRKYDVVFLDLMMPDFSGFDVLNSLTNERLMKKQPIFVFSAMTLPKEEEMRLLKQGVHNVLRKPIFLADLIKKIEMLQVH